eukprot:77807-Chlamydomonas_euryale.AAC.4
MRLGTQPSFVGCGRCGAGSALFRPTSHCLAHPPQDTWPCEGPSAAAASGAAEAAAVVQHARTMLEQQVWGGIRARPELVCGS